MRTEYTHDYTPEDSVSTGEDAREYKEDIRIPPNRYSPEEAEGGAWVGGRGIHRRCSHSYIEDGPDMEVYVGIDWV